MSTLTLPTTGTMARAVARDRLPVGALAALGGALVITGSALPWLSFFAGLQPIAGLDGLNGKVAAGLGAAAFMIGLLFLATGRPGLRWLIGILGFGVLVVAGLSGVNIASTVAELRADPLLLAQVGPGVPVLALGGALVFATMFLPMPAGTRASLPLSEAALRAPIAATLVVAGIVHLSLGPEHLAESLVLGSAMFAAGVGQLGLAILMLRRPSLALPLVLTIALNAAIVAAYLVAVTVGLPIIDGPATGGMAGMGEDVGHVDVVSALGIVTLLLEVAGAALAAATLAIRRTARRATAAVDGLASPAQ